MQKIKHFFRRLTRQRTPPKTPEVDEESAVVEKLPRDVISELRAKYEGLKYKELQNRQKKVCGCRFFISRIA